MDSPLSPGVRLGRYEIRSQIGAGGMGEVYLAQDTRLERTVALKILPANVAADRQRMQRFIQEAKAASGLNHPNILTIHEIEQLNSVHLIATEFIDGETLRQHLKVGRLETSEVLDISAQIASALVAAHAAGIIHRDIKPENIMLRRDGIVKVLDFGLAKLIEKVDAEHKIDAEAATKAQVQTEAGVVMGTVAYMSPEQARGKDVDARTDIFSLGAVVYEMLSGRAPFAGETGADIIGALIHKEPQSLSTLVPNTPAEMQHIVSKTLRKDPDERYETVKNLLVDLKTLKQDLDFAAKLDRSVSPDSKRAKRPGTDPTENEQKIRVPIAPGLLRRPSQRAVVLVGLLTTILLIAGVYAFWKKNSELAGEKQFKALAVLPFKPLTTDSRDESFEMGMAESIITNLSGIRQIVVRTMNSVRKYTDLQQDPAQAGRELQVDAVLHGSIQKTDNQVRVTVRLLDVQTGETLWADRFDEDLTHIFKVQDSISERLTRALKLRLSGEEQTNVTKRYTDDVEAYQLYLQGKYLWSTRQREDLWKSLEYFQRATDKDPNFAFAYIGLAESNLILLGRMLVPAHEAIPQAVAAMTKALEIGPKLAEAHNTLAEIKYQFQYDWPGAEREFKQASS